MTHNTALNTSLMVSVAIIAIGILLIVFMQYDKAQPFATGLPSYEQGKKNLMAILYDKGKATTESIVTTNQTVARQVVTPIAPYPVAPATTYPNTALSYEEMLLQNNPWSPHYQPAR